MQPTITYLLLTTYYLLLCTGKDATNQYVQQHGSLANIVTNLDNGIFIIGRLDSDHSRSESRGLTQPTKLKGM